MAFPGYSDIISGGCSAVVKRSVRKDSSFVDCVRLQYEFCIQAKDKVSLTSCILSLKMFP